MLLFDTESTQEKGTYPPSSNASARYRESREKLPDETVLITEVDNAAHEAKTKIGRLLLRVTRQLARWGLEVNGWVGARSNLLES